MIYKNKRDREAWIREKSIESMKENIYIDENDIIEVSSGNFYKVVKTTTDIPLKNNLFAQLVPSEVVGNISTATKLKTPRNIALSGDVTGNANFDGSTNISITATVGNDSHTHSNSTITSVDAEKVNSGVLSVERIPNLDASKITSGTINSDRLPILPVGKIPNLDASKITSGILSSDRIPGLDASKITSGIIDISRIPNAALERCIVVENDAARFSLTKSQVQVGDSVKVINPDDLMYVVVDDNKLNQEEGYVKYGAAVKWETIKDKPLKFPPESHTHSATEINQDETHRFVTDTEKASWTSKAEGNHSHKWESITGKPNAFAPSEHFHPANEIETDNQSMFVSLEEKDKWNLKANGDHNHDSVYAEIVHDHFADDITESENKKFISKEKLDILDKMNNSLKRTVTFLAGEGGTFSDGQSKKVVECFLNSDLPAFPEIHQNFSQLFYGWQIEPYSNITENKVIDNIVVTALYNKPVYTITFKCNEGGTFRETETDTLVKHITKGEKIPIPEMIVPISYEFSSWSPELTENTVATGNTTYTANFNFLGLNIELDDSSQLFEKKVAKNDEYNHIEYPNVSLYNEQPIVLE